MTVRNLDRLLRPGSVALIGASSRAGSVGRTVLANIVDGGFLGEIYAVNPHRMAIFGTTWSPSIAALPAIPDLAVVLTPARTVPGVIAELGALGTRAAVVVSAGVTDASGLRQAMLAAAKPYGLRIVGPNCVGMLMPHAKLNASFARGGAVPGKLALISQSGALVTAVLDWAGHRGIGFSGVVSVGDMADADLGDLIDVFAADPHTAAILMYVEGVTDAAKFISAARAASRSKPVIAIKAGRTAGAAKAAMSHTGALTGSYEVYQAAFERAGIVMVDTLTELFDAAEMLCSTRAVAGNQLAIVTNGGGAGILAVDALSGTSGTLAVLSAATLRALDALLPKGWSHGNPVDLIGDAHADRYRRSVDIVLRDSGVDAMLVMNCPTRLAQPLDLAEAVTFAVEDARRSGNRKPVLTCWLGDTNADAARPAFAAAKIPLFTTPNDAVRGFGFLLAAKSAAEALMVAPPTTAAPVRDRAAAQSIVAAVRADGRTVLSEVEAKALLAAYRVPVVPTLLARTVEAVTEACASLLPPYAVKIVSPHLSHKSDAGGVVLDLPDAAAAVTAARHMQEHIALAYPDAAIAGFAVETMVAHSGAHELIAGIADDATFGPVLMIGAGGTAVEVVRDKVLGLAPLDAGVARAMLGRTRIAALLAGYRNVPAADAEGVVAVLCALSDLAADLPDIAELDVNPLLVTAGGVIALDARVRLTDVASPPSRLVIRPVPVEWTADLVTRSGLECHVRPVRPDDEALLAAFFARVTPDDLRFRFLTGLRSVGHERLAAMTQVDYRRDISFLAFVGPDIVATATLAAEPDRIRAEVALTVRADMKRRGLGWTLLDHVLRYALAEGITIVESVESVDNDAAIEVAQDLGFAVASCSDDPSVKRVTRTLHAPIDHHSTQGA